MRPTPIAYPVWWSGLPGEKDMARLVSILALSSLLTHGNLAWGQLTLLRTFSTEAIIPRGPDGIAYHPDEDEL